MSDETREAVCTWCDHSAQGTALHNDEGRYDSCGAPDHGLAGTFVRTVHDPPVEEIHDDRCRRQYANQIGVDTCDCWKRLPAPQAEGDVREALAKVLHDAPSIRLCEGPAVNPDCVPCHADADAVLSSGLVVPVGEVELLREEIGSLGGDVALAVGQRDAALARVEAAKAEALREAADRVEDLWSGPMNSRSEKALIAWLRSEADRGPRTSPAPSSIPARLLSGEHVGREVVLPDGRRGRVHVVAGIVPVVSVKGEFAELLPDDVVTLVDEEAGS